MANNESSFPIVAHNLDEINKSKKKFVIASVVTNENISEMENFILYSVSRWNNLHDLRFFMLEETELTHKNKMSYINLERFQRSLYKGINLMIEKEVGKYANYKSLYDYIVRNHKGCCSPSIMQMPVYNSNGDILRCNAHVFDDRAKIGKFINGKLVFDREKYSRLFLEIEGKTDKCKKCLCSTYCEFGGDSCVNPIKQTDSYCKFMQDFFKKILIEVYYNPKLVSTSKIVTETYSGIKKVVHWEI